MTRAILKENPASLTVIERDERCLAALRQIETQYPGTLHIIAGDALQDQPLLDPKLKTRIIANLPYNIATPLLTGWLEAEPWPPFYSSLTLMFQKEVAERIVAAPGGKSYGRLSVLAQWRCTAELLFDISPQAFTPPPKVTSSVVHFEPRLQPLACRLTSLSRITAAAWKPSGPNKFQSADLSPWPTLMMRSQLVEQPFNEHFHANQPVPAHPFRVQNRLHPVK